MAANTNMSEKASMLHFAYLGALHPKPEILNLKSRKPCTNCKPYAEEMWYEFRPGSSLPCQVSGFEVFRVHALEFGV